MTAITRETHPSVRPGSKSAPDANSPTRHTGLLAWVREVAD